MGTVYGLDGQTGNVKWRYYVGRDMVDDPVPVSTIRIVMSSFVDPMRVKLLVWTERRAKSNGSVILCEPSYGVRVDAEDVLVSLRTGTIVSLEPESGQLKWATTLPQPVRLTPLVNSEKSHVYVIADHSNLYVLSRQDGKCKEVFYVGHREGTISAPPVHLLGQLFVFENKTTDRGVIHILQTDDTGLIFDTRSGSHRSSTATS